MGATGNIIRLMKSEGLNEWVM